MWYKKISPYRFFGLVTKHACDRRADRQKYDSQDRASIAASRRNNPTNSAQLTRNCIQIRAVVRIDIRRGTDTDMHTYTDGRDQYRFHLSYPSREMY